MRRKTENKLYDYTIPPLLQTYEDALEDLKRNLVLKAVDCVYKLFTGIKSYGNIRLYKCNGYKLYREDHEKELVFMCKTKHQ